jgi:hypothetical protein
VKTTGTEKRFWTLPSAALVLNASIVSNWDALGGGKLTSWEKVPLSGAPTDA